MIKKIKLPQSNIKYIKDEQLLTGNEYDKYVLGAIKDEYGGIYKAFIIKAIDYISYVLKNGKLDFKNCIESDTCISIPEDVSLNLEKEIMHLYYSDNEINDKRFTIDWDEISSEDDILKLRKTLTRRIVNLDRIVFDNNKNILLKQMYVSKTQNTKDDEAETRIIDFINAAKNL